LHSGIVAHILHPNESEESPVLAFLVAEPERTLVLETKTLLQKVPIGSLPENAQPRHRFEGVDKRSNHAH
jgi:hypothetical protein